MSHTSRVTLQNLNYKWPTVNQKPYKEHNPLINIFCMLYCILNKVSQRKENIKKIIKEDTFTVFVGEKPVYK